MNAVLRAGFLGVAYGIAYAFGFVVGRQVGMDELRDVILAELEREGYVESQRQAAPYQ